MRFAELVTNRHQTIVYLPATTHTMRDFRLSVAVFGWLAQQRVCPHNPRTCTFPQLLCICVDTHVINSQVRARANSI